MDELFIVTFQIVLCSNKPFFSLPFVWNADDKGIHPLAIFELITYIHKFYILFNTDLIILWIPFPISKTNCHAEILSLQSYGGHQRLAGPMCVLNDQL